MDILKFQIEEISNANLKLDEDIELSKQRMLLSNAEKIKLTLSTLYQSLYSGPKDNQSCYDILNSSIKSISAISELDKSYADIFSKLQEINYLLEDVSDVIRNSSDKIDFSPLQMDNVDERIDLITGLKRKYGNSIDEILNFCSKLEKELADIINNEAHICHLQSELNKYNLELYTLSKELHNERLKAAVLLEEMIGLQLWDLEIKNATFKVQIDFDDENKEGFYNYNLNGLCSVEFLISTNKGEPLKPLSKIASGGEMSRIMLAIKTILADIDKIPTLIFDEIDTGISGKASQKVANKLSKLSLNHQVICITHLPHIPSMANAHFLIEKDVRDGLTYSNITRLKGESINREIARIIGGGNISEITLKHAEEMLRIGMKDKQA
jgi:DNA repair protein RecN (Recombination protein N)